MFQNWRQKYAKVSNVIQNMKKKKSAGKPTEWGN